MCKGLGKRKGERVERVDGEVRGVAVVVVEFGGLSAERISSFSQSMALALRFS